TLPIARPERPCARRHPPHGTGTSQPGAAPPRRRRSHSPPPTPTATTATATITPTGDPPPPPPSPLPGPAATPPLPSPFRPDALAPATLVPAVVDVAPASPPTLPSAPSSSLPDFAESLALVVPVAVVVGVAVGPEPLALSAEGVSGGEVGPEGGGAVTGGSVG